MADNLGGVMVFGMIKNGKKSKLYIFKEGEEVNSSLYIKCLEEILIPFYENLP